MEAHAPKPLNAPSQTRLPPPFAGEGGRVAGLDRQAFSAIDHVSSAPSFEPTSRREGPP